MHLDSQAMAHLQAPLGGDPRAGTVMWGHQELPVSGWRDLDALQPLRAGEITLLDLQDRRGREILYGYMADTAVLGRTVLVADGGNFLDVYRLGHAARRRAVARLGAYAERRALNEVEAAVFDRVHIARGFTAHQFQSIVEDVLLERATGAARLDLLALDDGDDADHAHGWVDAAPARAPGEAAIGLLVAPGFLNMYLDDELSRDEAHTLAARALRSFRRLARRLGVPAIIMNDRLAPGSADPLRVELEDAASEVIAIRRAPGRGQALGLHLPRRGTSLLLPGAHRTRLDDFLSPAEVGATIPVAPWPEAGLRRNMYWGRFKDPAWLPRDGSNDTPAAPPAAV